MDVLIISEMVQDIPGIEIMYDIRKTNKFLPIIMICDQKSKRIESSLMKAGANIVLSKPLDPIIAVQTIDNLLKMKYIAENIKPKKRKTSLKKK